MRRNGAEHESIHSNDPFEQLKNVLPGDVVEVWMEDTYIVKTVFLCREMVGGRMFEWRWMFLSDDSLIEVSPDGYFRYREHRVMKQGTAAYQGLVAQDGALVRFEERVRDGTVDRRPVHVPIDDKQYQLTSTGTVGVRRLGDEPELIPWKSFSSTPEQNVYFGMVDSADEASVAVGIWTAHVCLSFGRELERSDIHAVYCKESR